MRRTSFLPLLTAILVACGNSQNGDRNGGMKPSSGDSPSMKMTDRPRADAYALPGFAVYAEDERLWVFREGSEAHQDFLAKGEPAKRVTRVGAGPDGLTVYGADEDTLAAFCAPHQFGQPGFAVIAEDGRLWIFRSNSRNHRMFLEMGEPAKSVTLIGAGPGGQTLRGVDKEILEDYLAHWKYAAPGYVVHGDGGRLWVFRAGSEAYHSFLSHGEPAKRVSLIGIGPEGRTLYGADAGVLRAYADSFQQQ